MATRAAAFLLLAVCLTGCRKTRLSPVTDGLLDDPAAQLTVASIYPWPDETMIPRELRNNARVRGCPILSSRRVTGGRERARIVRELRAAIGGRTAGITCNFEPHHALLLRSTTAASDILLCFKCGEVEWQERWGKHETHPPARYVRKDVRPLLDAVLQRP